MAKSNLWRVIKSVLHALIGVQSERNRREDFASGKASHFIVVALLVVLTFILCLVLLVKGVLYFS
ncbi:hypothetical protein MAQ5080_03426 [Marinomonas aquimarina]|uniref:DUF2970 domain-containing protein n=1 Tax=Marinomonas aquimarina TaxID=295068 RepID=A0A1A8TQS5_9GAMM|nr:DUF2970 domain-containing protein [Marinomonas aquimarina]SBS36332.1 hypothetical protein MAQ5080_03426 [Marinomonas aquimarina]